MRKSNLSPIDISQHQTPPPSSVQDYLARKYAALGIDPPEPNGHPPGHIPANLTDERSEAAPKPSAGDEPTDSAHPKGELGSDLTDKPCDEPSNVANLPPDPGSRTPDPAPAAAPPEAAPAPKPLTRDQRTALDLLDRGLSVTEIMDTLGYHRKTFYDWGKANPAFAHAAESARDNRRGVLADGVHDLQLAALSLVGNYIRSDNSPDSIRLRAASLVFRHAHSETLLPRRILATFTAPDGISPASPHVDIPAPLDPPHEDPGGPGTDHVPTESEHHSDLAGNQDEQRSDLGSFPGDQRSDLAHSTPEAESHQPKAASTPSPAEPSNQEPVSSTITPTSHTEETAESVRFVRFENAQSTTTPPSEPETAPAPSEIRTRNVRDGFPPSPERERRVPAELPVPPSPIPTAEGAPTSTVNNNAPNPSAEQSDRANSSPDPASPPVQPPAPPQKPRKPETLLTDAFLSATFLHKHEPRAAFETLLKHQLRAYAPATPQEELLTFRIAQESWILRRLDTFERVIADSAVTKVRDKHPNAAPVACIAMTYLEAKDTETTRFYERIAQQRKDHEAALDRLESKLQTLQHRREAREDRRESHEDRREARRQARQDRRASAVPKRQTPIPATALPFHPAPTLRATG